MEATSALQCYYIKLQESYFVIFLIPCTMDVELTCANIFQHVLIESRLFGGNITTIFGGGISRSGQEALRDMLRELQWVAVCCSVLQWVAVCYSVLQCVVVCCSVL